MRPPTRTEEAAIRELLWEWDAIGLRDEDSPRDEYDCMIAPLWSLLARGASTAEITSWVRRYAAEHIGLPSDPATDVRLASAVRQLPGT